jgi:hypothetical protein
MHNRGKECRDEKRDHDKDESERAFGASRLSVSRSEIGSNFLSPTRKKRRWREIPKIQTTRFEIFPVWTRKACEITVLGKARGQKRGAL